MTDVEAGMPAQVWRGWVLTSVVQPRSAGWIDGCSTSLDDEVHGRRWAGGVAIRMPRSRYALVIARIGWRMPSIRLIAWLAHPVRLARGRISWLLRGSRSMTSGG